MSRLATANSAAGFFDDFADLEEAISLVVNAQELLVAATMLADRALAVQFLENAESQIQRFKQLGAAAGWSEGWVDKPEFLPTANRQVRLALSVSLRVDAQRRHEAYLQAKNDALRSVEALRVKFDALSLQGGDQESRSNLVRPELAGPFISAPSRDDVREIARRRAVDAALNWCRDYNSEHPNRRVTGTTLAYAAIAAGVDLPCPASKFRARESYWSKHLKRLR